MKGDLIERLLELRAKATRGPWYVGGREHMLGSGDRNVITYPDDERMRNGKLAPCISLTANQHFDEGPHDIAFIVEMANALPELADTLASLQAQLAEMRAAADDVNHERDEALAEVTRLRGLLRDVVEEVDYCGHDPVDRGWPHIDDARAEVAALSHKQEDAA